MKLIYKIMTSALVMSVIYAKGQTTNLVVDVAKTKAKIQPTMYGIFFEDINFAADGGLYAEMIKNRSFEFDSRLMGWIQPNTDYKRFLNKESGIAVPVNIPDSKNNHNFCRVTINNSQNYELINEGFRGMGIKKGAKYNLSLNAANGQNSIKKIIIQFIDNDKKVLGETSIVPNFADWKTYTTQIVATATQAKAKLKLTFEGIGVIDLDMISLFPEDTWKNRKNGMRRDIVELLADLKPGFMRFPGGCIIEGKTLSNRYQWKKTLGDIKERETMISLWNTQFVNKLTPDYFQSFGLGFFEYFQLSEDIGAEPLPILSCGMACQYITGELVPIDKLDPYVQDALDLIEFANGETTSKWGKIRSDMGHPKPFNLKFIGIGNEQWGPDYIERYKVFTKAIREKYPNIKIVSGSGPKPSGEFFEYSMEELKKLKADIIDEHYYESPKWFKNNAARYDSYDRKGPKVFAGEYAAHSEKGSGGERKNTWEAALSEAAFMTGLERNADVVTMTSYAPLLAHEEAWQWSPDLIWFNNLETYGTVNYYVQKMYSNNAGTDLISITKEGKALSGQDNLYASAVKDEIKKEVIIKIVNTNPLSREMNIDLKGFKGASVATVLIMQNDNLVTQNTFEAPMKMVPLESEIILKSSKIKMALSSNSFTIIKVKMK